MSEVCRLSRVRKVDGSEVGIEFVEFCEDVEVSNND